MKAIRILGVDPGSRLTGYGCVDLKGRALSLVGHGTLKLANTSGKATVPLEDRLLAIYEGLSEAIQRFKPDILVIEKVFFAKNAVSSLKLGQARGAVILTGKIHGLEIVEYSATEVKQAVVGYGQADKDQVSKMVQLLIGRQQFKTSDASDALAIAICHAFRMNHTSSLRSEHPRRRKKKLTLAQAVGLAR